MELKQMRSFLSIAQTGSFTISADKLCLTQSALSHQISQLELTLGAKLFARSRPHVVLTEAGQALLPSVERILAEMDEVRAKFGLDAQSGEPTIRAASTAFGFAYVYGDLCHAFVKRHSDINLDFSATDTPEAAVSRVLARTADAAFVPVSLQSPLLNTLVLAEVEHVFIIGPEHPLSDRREVDPQDLQAYPFVRYHRGTGSRAMSDVVFSRTAYPRVLTESNDTDFVKRIVSIGLGVALVPIFAVVAELKAGTLRAVRLRDQRIRDVCGVVTNTHQTLRTLEKFREVCLFCRGPGPRKFTLETLDAVSFNVPQAA